jgi:hypothetical protein
MMEAQALEDAKPFAQAREKYAELEADLASDAMGSMTHSQVEHLLETEGRELLRRLLQGYLDLRSMREDRARTVVGSDGEEHTHRRKRSRSLLAVFGVVQVARLAFAGRGQASLMPLDAELNLPEQRYSFGLQRRVVEEVIRGSFDEAVDAVVRTTGASVPKRQAEEAVLRAAERFDLFYTAGGGQFAAADTPSDHLLVMTVDCKGIVMRREALREATRRAAEEADRLEKGSATGMKRHNRRMAAVASVYTVAPQRRTPQDIVRDLRPVRDPDRPKPPRPLNKRVWASVVKDLEEVIAAMFKEALRRDPDRKMRWVAVVDGDPKQIRHLRAYAAELGVNLTIILDIIHVIGYLGTATAAVHGTGKAETDRVVTERLIKVLGGRSVDVAAGIKQSATKRRLKGKGRKRTLKAANYLLNHADLVDYHSYLAAGLPIASGVIEGACRYLVKDRMDITGARWGLDSAEAVLKLRALKASGDLDLYWSFYERMHWDSVHAHRYAHSTPPSTTRPARRQPAHLRLVGEPS